MSKVTQYQKMQKKLFQEKAKNNALLKKLEVKERYESRRLIKPAGTKLFIKNKITKVVASEFGLHPMDLWRKSRQYKYRVPRQIVMYIFIRYYNIGPTEAGRWFGQSHSNAKHAHRTVTNEKGYDKALETRLNKIVNSLKVQIGFPEDIQKKAPQISKIDENRLKFKAKIDESLNKLITENKTFHEVSEELMDFIWPTIRMLTEANDKKKKNSVYEIISTCKVCGTGFKEGINNYCSDECEKIDRCNLTDFRKM